jgi:hypothetical protein
LLPVRPSVALGQGVTPRTALEPPRSDVAAPPHDPSVAWAGQPAEERALGESLAVPEELAADPKAQIPAGQTLLRLSKEVALVDRAWGAMKRSEFSRALIELANYEEQYPELGLHPEVLFVRMEAEDRLGRVAAAKREAARLLASYSQSAQAGRARALLQRP